MIVLLTLQSYPLRLRNHATNNKPTSTPPFSLRTPPLLRCVQVPDLATTSSTAVMECHISNFLSQPSCSIPSPGVQAREDDAGMADTGG
jgi:hypothetical protein